MDDYLSKPFTQQELASTLARWIALPRAATVHHADAAMEAPLPRPQPQPASVAVVEPAAGLNPQALDNIRALSGSGADGLENTLLEKVITAFAGDTPRQLASLRTAIAARDTEAMRRVAHSLKSGSANVGADALALQCKEMEKLGRAGSTDGAARLLQSMDQQFLAVRDALGRLLVKEH